MDPRIQSILIILITLTIGFGAGFVTSGRIASQRMEKMRGQLDRGDGFAGHIVRMVDADEAQAEQIKEIVSDRFPQIKSIQRQFARDMRQEMNLLRQDLAPILTDEQMQKLRRRMRFMPGLRKRRHNKPPPR